MSRRAIIITGGTSALGFEAARAIALGDYPGAENDKNEYLLVLVSRTDKDKAADAINAQVAKLPAHRKKLAKTPKAVYRRLDLGDIDNVRQFAKDWATGTAKGDVDNYPPIRALVLNAGLQFPNGLVTLPSGVEATFAVNHLGHALLFHLLAPFLEDSPNAPPSRVVITGSGTHDPAQLSGMPPAKYTSAEDLAHPPPDMIDIDGRQRYPSSKLANILWIYALDRRLQAAKKNIVANSFDPGLMPGTGLAREYSAPARFVWSHVLPHIIPLLRLLISPNTHTIKESGQNMARVVVGVEDPAKCDEPVQNVHGKYFEMRKTIPSSVVSYEEAKQDDLWNWCIKFTTKGDAAEEARFQELR